MTLHPTRHITGHFRDESLEAITCTGTDNSKQTRVNHKKTTNAQKTQNRQIGSR